MFCRACGRQMSRGAAGGKTDPFYCTGCDRTAGRCRCAARQPWTREELARALHERGLGCWEPRGPGGSLCEDASKGNPLNDLHTPTADRLLAALEAIVAEYDLHVRCRTDYEDDRCSLPSDMSPLIDNARAALAAASPEPERCAVSRLDEGDWCRTHRVWTDEGHAAPTVEALREHPGEHHTFSMTCDRCGKRGYVNLSVIGPDERLSIERIGDIP